MAGEFSTVGTKLEVKASTETTWKECYGLYNTPDMGGNKEKIDVTNLKDTHKRTVDGVADFGSLQFDFYDSKGTTDTAAQINQVYAQFRTWELAGTTVNFKLTYPDGSGFTWGGTVSTSKDAAAVNSAMKFKIYSSLSEEMPSFSGTVQTTSTTKS